MTKHICKDCGASFDNPKLFTKGHFFMEIVLWLLILIPGIIYSIWRHTSRHEVCPKCDSRNFVAMESPMGKRLAQELGQYNAEPVYHGTKGRALGLAVGRLAGRMLGKSRSSAASGVHKRPT